MDMRHHSYPVPFRDHKAPASWNLAFLREQEDLELAVCEELLSLTKREDAIFDLTRFIQEWLPVDAPAHWMLRNGDTFETLSPNWFLLRMACQGEYEHESDETRPHGEVSIHVL